MCDEKSHVYQIRAGSHLGPLYIRARAQSKTGPIHLHMDLHLGHFFGIGPMIEPSNIKWLGLSVGPKPMINHLQ